MKKKIILSTLIILGVVAASLGATFAWFTAQSDPIENVFVAGTVEIDAEETQFVTDGFYALNWNPGDCAEKEYEITNVGTKKIKLRAMVETQWYEWVGEGPPEAFDVENLGWAVWTPDGEDAASVALLVTDPVQGWTQEADGNWYYDDIIDGTYVEGGANSEPVSVYLWLKVCLDGPLAGNQYQGKAYTVNVTYQAIQASHEDEWEWNEIDFETGLEL
ncbi:MAG: TasA family protein [Dethiobacteria bacterium]|nr:TasA family protein [Dethiobacteria bacterium]